MLEPFGRYHSVFVEITKSVHQHGGAGWEFGRCLWSPTRNRAGQDPYRLMREPQRDDLVLHFREFEQADARVATLRPVIG